MSERYWITGVQLGILTVLIDKDAEQAKTLLKMIEEDQFIGHVEPERIEPICEDYIERVT